MVTREEEFVTDNTSSLWQRQCRFGKDVYEGISFKPAMFVCEADVDSVDTFIK